MVEHWWNGSAWVLAFVVRDANGLVVTRRLL